MIFDNTVYKRELSHKRSDIVTHIFNLFDDFCRAAGMSKFLVERKLFNEHNPPHPIKKGVINMSTIASGNVSTSTKVTRVDPM